MVYIFCALKALDEILELREELFNAQMTMKNRTRKARKIHRLAFELAQE